MTQEWIDCSNNNGTVNWGEVAKSGVKGAYCKASEGTGFIDITYGPNRAGCKTHGLLFGAYHFARPDQSSPQAEADHFLAAARPRPGDLLPCLDFETSPLSSAWAAGFVSRVHDELGVYPLLYANTSTLSLLGQNATLRHCPIWAASWSSTEPRPPGGWKVVSVWQYSGHGHCPGVAGECDRDKAYVVHQYKPPTVWTVKDGSGRLIARTNHPKLWVARHRPFHSHRTVTFHKT